MCSCEEKRESRREETRTTCQPSAMNLGITSLSCSGAMRMKPRVSGLSAYGSYSYGYVRARQAGAEQARKKG